MLSRKSLTSCICLNKRFFSSSISSSTSDGSSKNSKMPRDLLRKPTQTLSNFGLDKLEKISISMKVYLEQSQKNAEMINKQREEYELGKRHLANLMGFDYHNMTEKNIKEAVEYLLPSGLFSARNRPAFLAPEEVYPRIKSADFDKTGRPFHFLAYTGKPIFYEAMHQIYEFYSKCEQLKDQMMANGVLNPPPSAKVDLTGSRWINKKEYAVKNEEFIPPDLWDAFTSSLERLANHPYSKDAKEFLMQFRVELGSRSAALNITPITFTEDGRPYVQAEGLRNHSKAQVTIWGNGTGNITINGHDILYFPEIKERHQVLFPLLFTDMVNKVDVEAQVEGVGESSQAGAIRHGISLALMSYVEKQMVEKMRLAGLLTKDRRVKERKKIGKAGARKSPKFRPR